MTKLIFPVRAQRFFSRVAAIALGAAALSLFAPLAAHADGKNHGPRHENHAGYDYRSDYGFHGPPPVYFHGGPPPCRGPKHVKAYRYYPQPVYAQPVYVVPVPRFVRPPVLVHVNWVFGF